MARTDDFYLTRQGQTWDEIALEVYGKETYAGYLMQCNYDLLDTLIFSAGELVYTPDIVEVDEDGAPPWVQDEDGEGLEAYA